MTSPSAPPDAAALEVRAPLAGTVAALEDVPDQVFSQRIMGPGVAIIPDEGAHEVGAPVTGTVATLWYHATIVAPAGTPQGTGVLVHLGIDTVHLREEAYDRRAEKGQDVAAGDPLIHWDSDVARAKGLATHTPVILIEPPGDTAVSLSDAPAPGTHVAAGDVLFRVTLA